jgi:hypothetical protein
MIDTRSRFVGRCVGLWLGWSRRLLRRSLVTRPGGFGRWCGWRRRGLPLRKWFAGSGGGPASIRSRADLPRLPLLDRSHLVHESDQLPLYPRRLMRVAHSSGTSGRVVTVHRTPGSSAFELSALQRQWSWLDVPASAAESAAAEQRPGSAGDRRIDPEVSGGVAAGRLQLPVEPGAAASAVRPGPSVRPAGGRGMGHRASRSWLRCCAIVGSDYR